MAEEQAVQPAQRVGGFFSGRLDIRLQFRVQQVEDRVEHGVLALEMPVNARGHQAHAAGHGGDAQPFDALAGHQLQRGLGDLFAADSSLQFGVGHGNTSYCDYTFTIGGNPGDLECGGLPAFFQFSGWPGRRLQHVSGERDRLCATLTAAL